MADEGLPRIAIDRLRIGMFIHLDVGWREHPFPFNSFKLRSDDQIATLKSLGLDSLRWDPARSDVAPLPAVVVPESEPAAPPSARAAPAAPVVAEALRERLKRQQDQLYRSETRFLEASRTVRQVLGSVRQDPDGARERAEQVVESMAREVEGDNEATIRLLSERVGDEGSSHAVNVSVLSLLLARACGLAPAALRDAAIGGLLHDIGKLDLPGFLQLNADQLAEHERKAVEKHVEFGVEAGRRMGLGRGALRAIAEHHERSDGSGYPTAIKGEGISPVGRIVGLVNHYENLVNPGGSRAGLTPHEAISLIYAKQRPAFDERTLGLFVRMMGIYPPGSLIELGDGRIALVLSATPDQPLRPRVAVLDGEGSLDDAVLLDLAAAPELAVKRSLRPEQLDEPRRAQLGARRRHCYYLEPRELGAGSPG